MPWTTYRAAVSVVGACSPLRPQRPHGLESFQSRAISTAGIVNCGRGCQGRRVKRSLSRLPRHITDIRQGGLLQSLHEVLLRIGDDFFFSFLSTEAKPFKISSKNVEQWSSGGPWRWWGAGGWPVASWVLASDNWRNMWAMAGRGTLHKAWPAAHFGPPLPTDPVRDRTDPIPQIRHQSPLNPVFPGPNQEMNFSHSFRPWRASAQSLRKNFLAARRINCFAIIFRSLVLVLVPTRMPAPSSSMSRSQLPAGSMTCDRKAMLRRNLLGLPAAGPVRDGLTSASYRVSITAMLAAPAYSRCMVHGFPMTCPTFSSGQAHPPNMRHRSKLVGVSGYWEVCR